MLRSIHRMVVLLSAGMAVVVITTGPISFYRAIPKEGLWISSMTPQSRVQCAVVDGILYVVHSRLALQAGTPAKEKECAGLSIKTKRVGATTASGIGIPFWAAGIVFSAYPLMTLACGPLRRRRRRRRGACPSCGYSLRGFPEPRCPECGQVFDPNQIRIPPAV